MTSYFYLCCRREKGEVQGNAESDYDSEEENEDGDLTVYECPGLAPVSSMEENCKNTIWERPREMEVGKIVVNEW